MKKRWQLRDEATDAVDTHRVEHVLEQHDGPVAISLRDGDGRRFFAVAADDEGEVTRWIEVEIGEGEWRSLLHGRTALRDVFRKASVYVVDRRSDLSVEKAWAVTIGSLQDAHLPAQDAFFEEGDFTVLLDGITPACAPSLTDREAPAEDRGSFFPREPDQAA